ncbi:MAG: BamA/TamA family outer membrane protein, partial [Candidatus Dadabacteria bacterium]
MKKLTTVLFTTVFYLISYSQVDSIYQRIFFVGDAGELHGTVQPVIDWLAKNVDWNDPKNMVLYLGDNVYPLGLPMKGEPGYEEGKKVLDYEVNLVKGKKGTAIFIPGNHDWKNGMLGGWQQAINQEDYINALAQKNIQFPLTGGCPGPVAVDLSSKVVGVFIDTQWFLYVHDKPGPGSSCTSRTMDEFTTELKEIVAAHPNQLLLVAMHHPMHTYGVHGGDYTWKEHIFPFTAVRPNLYIPLPILGSVYPLARGVFGSLQDYNHPLYQQMVKTIEDVMKTHRNPINVAGHDHSLQFIMIDSIPYVVSGSGTYTSRVNQNKSPNLKFSEVQNGLSMLEIRKSGKLEIKFYDINSANLNTPIFHQQLKTIDTLAVTRSTEAFPNLPDSVLVAANPDLKAGPLGKFFNGKNFRKEWTTPVRVPVLDLGREQNGLTPLRAAGGQQHRSLTLQDKSGKEWMLRSLQKYPEAVIPPDLRENIIREKAEGGVSASYPFSGLTIPPLAKAEDVLVVRRKVLYIPDDPRLGRFRPLFKNSLATLEEMEPDHIKKTYNTDEVVLQIQKDNDFHADQEQVLKARLLDNFYMDFDRHEGQWRWATRDTGKGKIFFAIPLDQDQAFHINEGLFPKTIRGAWRVPELQGFSAKAANINTFNRPARNFDRFFLNELDESAWKVQVDSFLSRMTDATIDLALQQQPREVYRFHGPKLANILKDRRNYFKEEMLKYYRFLSREVNIVGTNKKELFSIVREPDGSTAVTVNKLDSLNNVSSTIYHRVFDPSVTKALNIYGLQDPDSFVISGGNSPIKVRIVGGGGDDAFVNNATGGRTVVFDVSFENNHFYGSPAGVIRKVTGNPQLNMYSRQFYKYGYLRPDLSLGYNVDDGVYIGPKIEIITQGFRKEPYAMRHFISGTYAFRTSSYRFKYDADFTDVFGTSDLVIRSEVKAPKYITNFFGYGNNSVFDKNVTGKEQYYQTQYNMVNASVMYRKQLQSWMRASFGPTFQYFHLDRTGNLGKFVSNTTASGLDNQSLFDGKTFVGAEALLDINSRNNQALPTRGFLLDAGVKSLVGVSGNSNFLTQAHWDMSVIASFAPKATMVYAFRLGVATNWGNFEMPQAQYLSGTENLRGYRRNRFAGRTVFFQNTELRLKLADFSTYLFPGAVGLLAFNDVGKVWMPKVESSTW